MKYECTTGWFNIAYQIKSLLCDFQLNAFDTMCELGSQLSLIDRTLIASFAIHKQTLIAFIIMMKANKRIIPIKVTFNLNLFKRFWFWSLSARHFDLEICLLKLMFHTLFVNSCIVNYVWWIFYGNRFSWSSAWLKVNRIFLWIIQKCASIIHQ